jgi:hypothetical protein
MATDNTRVAAPEADLLVWRTRESSRHLLMALTYSLGIACATGVALLLPLQNGHLTLIALVAHLVSGTLAVLFFVPFLFVHLRDGKEPLRHLVMPWHLSRRKFRDRGRDKSQQQRQRQHLMGYLLCVCACLASLSGLAIAAPALAYLAGHPVVPPFGTIAVLLRVHQASSALLFVFLLLHFPKKASS